MTNRSVRLAVKAVIVRDGRVLMVRNRDEEGDWYLLPGGGQRSGETLVEALQRECLEEIGTTVEQGRLLWIRDYIGKNHEFAETDADMHQVELMFRCEVPADYRETVGSEPDGDQLGVEWLSLPDLDRYRIYPSQLVELLPRHATVTRTVYLGDVN